MFKSSRAPKLVLLIELALEMSKYFLLELKTLTIILL